MGRLDKAQNPTSQKRCADGRFPVVWLRGVVPVILLATAACGGSEVVPDTCNGSTSQCGRRFTNVTFPATNVSPATLEDGFLFPRQRFSIPTQLADGIRGLKFEVHVANGMDGKPGAVVCHGLCEAGSKSLKDAMKEVTDFLNANRDAIVTLFLQVRSDVPTFQEDKEVKDAIRGAVEDSRLDAYLLRRPDAAAPFPTVGEMIEVGTRAVVLTSSASDNSAGLIDLNDFSFGTDELAERQPVEDTCDVVQGEIGTEIFVLNHYLTTVGGSELIAESVNYNPQLFDRVELCDEEFGKVPNFIAVDFYHIGDLFDAVERANRDL